MQVISDSFISALHTVRDSLLHPDAEYYSSSPVALAEAEFGEEAPMRGEVLWLVHCSQV